MIITQYTGTGYGMMSGVREYIKLFEDEDALLDAMADARCTSRDDFFVADASPGFTFDKAYDTEVDCDFCGLPFDSILANRH